MYVSGVNYESIVDGSRVRCTIFVSGCSHNCKGCHNPDTHDEKFGTLFTDEIKETIFSEIRKRTFLDGITLSGGDPLYDSNVEDIYNFILDFKKEFPNMTIWLYTGFTFEEIRADNFDDIGNYRNMILRLIDVLVDGKFILEQKDLRLAFRGSSNQRVIDVQKSLKSNKIILHSSNY